MRLGPGRLFFDADGVAFGIEFDYAVALRIVDAIGENDGAAVEGRGALKVQRERLAVKNVVAEDKGASVAADEVAADNESLGEAVWTRLNGVTEVQSPLASVAEELGKTRGILRRRNDEYVANP